MHLIGLDVGTTGCKAVVFREDGLPLGRGFREYGVDTTGEPGKAEQDAERVWKLACSALEEAVRKSRIRSAAALAVSVQGDAVIAVDKHHHPIHPALLGMDYRSARESRDAVERFGGRRLFALTGMRSHPINSINKIFWLKRNRPGVFSRARRIVTYADYILARLGGESVMDHTMASRTMAFDLKKKSWSRAILSGLGIDPALLSATAPSGTVAGELSAKLSESLGLRTGTLLATGGHDQTCAGLGAGVVDTRRCVVSTGTAEVMFAVSDRPRLGPEMYEGYYPCYLHAVDGMYATFSLNHTGGILLRWYRDQFASEEVGSAVRNGLDAYELILSRIPDGPSTVMVLPHHNGSGTPHCDLDSRGAIAGLTLATTRHEICRAILESLVFELRINRDRMSRAGIRPSECVAVGGGARSPLWLQLKADILGTPVRTLNHGDAACHGAAMLAGKAAGVYASLEQAVAAGVRYGRVFQPDPARRRTYDRRYRVYEGLYPAMKTFHHHLIRENAKFSEGSKR